MNSGIFRVARTLYADLHFEDADGVLPLGAGRNGGARERLGVLDRSANWAEPVLSAAQADADATVGGIQLRFRARVTNPRVGRARAAIVPLAANAAELVAELAANLAQSVARRNAANDRRSQQLQESLQLQAAKLNAAEDLLADALGAVRLDGVALVGQHAQFGEYELVARKEFPVLADAEGDTVEANVVGARSLLQYVDVLAADASQQVAAEVARDNGRHYKVVMQ